MKKLAFIAVAFVAAAFMISCDSLKETPVTIDLPDEIKFTVPATPTVKSDADPYSFAGTVTLTKEGALKLPLGQYLTKVKEFSAKAVTISCPGQTTYQINDVTIKASNAKPGGSVFETFGPFNFTNGGTPPAGLTGFASIVVTKLLAGNDVKLDIAGTTNIGPNAYNILITITEASLKITPLKD